MQEHFDPEYIQVPGLAEIYVLFFDKNHAMPITTEFVMNEIVWPDEGKYRHESIMQGLHGQGAPNWLIFLKMDDCYYCEQMAPLVDMVAREFHKEESPHNYFVASVNCSEQSAVFLC